MENGRVERRGLSYTVASQASPPTPSPTHACSFPPLPRPLALLSTQALTHSHNPYSHLSHSLTRPLTPQSPTDRRTHRRSPPRPVEISICVARRSPRARGPRSPRLTTSASALPRHTVVLPSSYCVLGRRHLVVNPHARVAVRAALRHHVAPADLTKSYAVW